MSDDPTPAWGAPDTAHQEQRPDGPGQQWQQPPPGANQPAYPPPPTPDYWSGSPGGYPAGGQYPAGYVPPYPGPMAPSTSGWAIASLILSICGWTVLPLLGAIGGVVAGHVALHEIASSDGRMQGRGFAVAGLVVGYAAIALMLCAIVFAIALVAVAIPSR